jgi:hypothetical protein
LVPEPKALLKYLLTIIWSAVLGVAFYHVTDRLRSEANLSAERLSTPPLSRLSTSMLNVVTLGHRGLYDDFADIWLLQTLGDQKVKQLDPKALVDTIKMVTRHGPKLESLYLLSCFVLAFELQQPNECLGITIDGIKALPLSWRVPMTQGYVDAFLLNDPASAALYYELASSRPGAPTYLRGFATKLAARVELSPEERQVAKEHFFHTLGIAERDAPSTSVLEPKVETQGGAAGAN